MFRHTSTKTFFIIFLKFKIINWASCVCQATTEITTCLIHTYMWTSVGYKPKLSYQ